MRQLCSGRAAPAPSHGYMVSKSEKAILSAFDGLATLWLAWENGKAGACSVGFCLYVCGPLRVNFAGINFLYLLLIILLLVCVVGGVCGAHTLQASFGACDGLVVFPFHTRRPGASFPSASSFTYGVWCCATTLFV